MHLRRSRSRCFALLLAMLPALPLAAQIPVADSAWTVGDYAAARVGYERALHDNPGEVRALYRLAVLASWAGRLDSALALLRDAREIEPADPDVRLEEAKVLAWDGQYTGSILRYDSLLAATPDYHDAAIGRAQALAWAGHLPEAEQAYATLIERNPDDMEARAGRGQVASWRGDLAGAAHHYIDALARQPDHVPSLVGMAQVRQWQGRPDDAQRYASQAIALAPDSPKPRADRAYLHSRLGDWTAALADLDAAAKAGDGRQYCCDRGLVLLSLGRAAEAREELTKAAAGRFDPETEFHLGRALLIEGKPDEAAARIRSALKPDGRRPPRERFFEMMEGVAVALSVSDPSLLAHENFGIRLNWGSFKGENAIGLTAMGVLDRNVFGGGERLAIGAGLGVGLNDGAMGGRVGLQLTW